MKLTIDSRKLQCPLENNLKANQATKQKKEFSLKVKKSISGGTNIMKKRQQTHTHTKRKQNTKEPLTINRLKMIQSRNKTKELIRRGPE